MMLALLFDAAHGLKTLNIQVGFLSTLLCDITLWDPSYATYVNKLESRFAAKVETKIWYDNYDALLNHLNWERVSTKKKKKTKSISLFFKFVFIFIFILFSHFSFL